MTYEYYWLRNWVPLISDQQIQQDLQHRTVLFNSLGKSGWELMSSMGGNGDFCFRRPYSVSSRKKYEYYWLRNYISLTSNEQIQQDFDKRSQIFNKLSANGWELIMDSLSMFCFVRCANSTS